MPTDPTILLASAVLAPLVLGLATLLLPRGAIALRVLLALTGPLLSVGALAAFWAEHTLGAPPVAIPLAPSVNLNLDLVADQLGMFFALLVAGIGVLIVIYARGYFGPDAPSLRRFFPTLGFFTTAMLGIVLSDSFLGTFLFWEMTSVSSFLLIGWDRESPRAVRLAVQAFVTTGLGGMALLGGLILLALQTGAWSFSALAEAPIGLDAPTIVAFALIFAGAAAKSAQFPLHFWLPGAMAAPTPVSAYLHSATMVKAGVYLLARLFPVLAVIPFWDQTLIAFGATTMLLGAYLAVRSSELKQIFAYTTVSQLGLLVCAYGLGSFSYKGEANLIWPVTQIVNHALYKAPLFIMAGAIMHRAGRKQLHELRGLVREHPLLAVLTLLAAYALAGGPFTLSFVAKEAFFYQVVHAAGEIPVVWVVAGMGVLTAVCNVTIFVRFVTTFLSAPAGEREGHELAHAEEHHHAERGFWGSCIWWPAAALILWQYVGGLAPGLIEPWLRAVETHTLYFEHLPSILQVHAGWPLYMSVLAFILGIALGVSPLLSRPEPDPYNRAFPGAMRLGERLGLRTFCSVQTGNFRHYVIAVLGALLVGSVLIAVMDPSLRSLPRWGSMGNADIGDYLISILLTLLICATAVAIPFTGRRITRVLALGACGFAVTGMYLVYQAPDLALTQLMFEIISILLFLLVLRLLPEEHRVRYVISRWGRGIFAAAVGLVVGWVVLLGGSVADQAHERGIPRLAHTTADHSLVAAAGQDGALTKKPATPLADEPRLGDWFLHHSYKGTAQTAGRGGAGTNAVNVILVDFRGYDTLGEITVLVTAVIGVLAMLAAAPGASSAGARHEDRLACTVGPQPHLRSALLQTAMKLILPLTLIFAGYMFFKGHNAPGGGFIAGLVAAVALSVFRMSFGGEALRSLLPFKPGPTVAVGLVVALATAIVPMLFGHAAMRSADWYIPLPGSESDFHLTSVLFFDLGVFLVVVGASVGMINRLEEELE